MRSLAAILAHQRPDAVKDQIAPAACTVHRLFSFQGGVVMTLEPFAGSAKTRTKE
jgi:hypothetical protein